MPQPTGPQWSSMTDEQLQKAHASAWRRLNNLESRYGGTISPGTSGDSMARPSDRWWTKKQKLLTEKSEISEEMKKRQS